jgi:hypothetical protein
MALITTNTIPDLTPVDPAFRRRPFLLAPGQPLVGACDPVQSVLDYESSLTAIGIAPEHMVASKMSAIAFPENAGRPPDGSSRRYPGVRPEVMWLPLLWLPERLAGRCRFQVVDGEVFVIDPALSGPNVLTKPAVGFEVFTETQDLWVVRVGLELEASGVYDRHTGTWFDVLAHADLDVDDPSDLRRVRAWLDGSADADLDALDTGLEMDGIISDPDDPTWAVSSALAMHQSMLDQVWATGADSLLGMTDDLALSIMSGAITSVDQARQPLVAVCSLAASWMQWYRARPTDARQAESAWWQEARADMERFAGSLDDLVAGPLATISARLQAIREDCLERLADQDRP